MQHNQHAQRPQLSRQGFTLIEVMVAAAIFAIGTSASLAGISTAYKQYAHQRHMTNAINVAEGVMESLLLAYGTDARIGVGSHGPLYFSEEGVQTASPSAYQVTWAVIADQPIAGMRQIDTRVGWIEPAGRRSIAFTTVRE